jgi:hypothetical protein
MRNLYLISALMQISPATRYGAWLHGQSPGSVDDEHNEVGAPFVDPNPNRRAANQQQMTQEPYLLDAFAISPITRSSPSISASWSLESMT